MVGIGTRKGGLIPIRTRNRNFIGYKKYNSKNIITKLNENTFVRLKKKIKNLKYWIVTSYDMPTDGVIDFFNNIHSTKFSDRKITSMPALSNYLIIPGILMLLLSSLARIFKTFKISTTSVQSILIYMVLFLFSGINSMAVVQIESLKEGKISSSNRLQLGQNLFDMKEFEKASILYEEALSEIKTKDENYINGMFNYGTLLLKLNRIPEGLKIYSRLNNEINKK